MLAIGAILFIGVGCLVVTAVDSVPRNLVVNALVLGALSIVTGMVFVLDTCLSHKRNDKESHMSKSTRYGDIARTTTNGARKSGEYVNGRTATTNGGEYVNGRTAATNGLQYSNGGGSSIRESVEKKRNDGLLQTTPATADDGGKGSYGHVETKNESVQTSLDEPDGGASAAVVHRYGRGSDGGQHKHHTDWYDTDMDLSRMKKLEINVLDSPDYPHRGGSRYVYI